MSPDCTVYLIDTPGFDDINKSDTDVLKEIAAWLSDSYRHNIRLHGIIYLHRIIDTRMQGSAKRNLIMFKQLCGQDALKRVILVTSMWDKIPSEEATKREKELKETPEFWGWMLQKGSSCYRHNNTLASAQRIVHELAGHHAPIATEIQKQLVDEARTLDKTSAGQELESDLIKEREKWTKKRQEIERQMQEAMEQRDRESQEALLEERDRYTRMIKKAESNTEALRSSMEKLIAQRQERVAQLERLLKEQQSAHEIELTQFKERQMEAERKQPACYEKELAQFQGHLELERKQQVSQEEYQEELKRIEQKRMKLEKEKAELEQETKKAEETQLRRSQQRAAGGTVTGQLLARQENPFSVALSGSYYVVISTAYTRR